MHLADLYYVVNPMRTLIQHLVLLALLAIPATTLLAANQLKDNPSPYLALHGDDPVDWHEFDEAAMAQARAQDKLIFISVGYFSCHWCHVMQRESFSNKEVAEALNKGFISIKVDRELNPALDDRLMNFAQATTGRGGWPLNVFLTPEGYPLFAMTYAPPSEFGSIVYELSARWQSEREQLEQAAKEVDAELAGAGNELDELQTGITPVKLRDEFIAAALRHADELKGGFGQRAKFPSEPQLDALLAAPQKQETREFLKTTLDHMATQGLRDVVGGGFFRYTVDPNWETPHYEKMLYTNALLASLYTKAAQRLDHATYHNVASDTLEFAIREMRAQDGLFISSLSAVDAQNVEGGFYLWQAKTLKHILSSDELDLVNVAWGMDRYERDDIDILPVWKMSPAEVQRAFEMRPEVFDKKMQLIRKKLIDYRNKTRSLPKDDKRLSGWNGLMLTAFAKNLQQEKTFKSDGAALAAAIRSHFWDGKTLIKGIDATGKSFGKGSLEDYAYVGAGLLDWAIATKSPQDRAAAVAIIEAAWEKFHTEKGWRRAEVSLMPNPVFEQHLVDGALPSPEALLIGATLKLNASQNKEQALIKQAQAVIKQITKGVAQSPFYYATFIEQMNHKH